MKRLGKYNPGIVEPQMLLAVIEATDIEAGPGLVDLSERPEIGPASWFLATDNRFIEDRPSPSHFWSNGGWVLDAALDTAAFVYAERVWRDSELGSVVWLRDRHRDQLEIGVPTTMTPEQFTELLLFIQSLRDWPQSEAFPDTSARPVAPAFLEQMRVDQ